MLVASESCSGEDTFTSNRECDDGRRGRHHENRPPRVMVRARAGATLETWQKRARSRRQISRLYKGLVPTCRPQNATLGARPLAPTHRGRVMRHGRNLRTVSIRSPSWRVKPSRGYKNWCQFAMAECLSPPSPFSAERHSSWRPTWPRLQALAWSSRHAGTPT
jgi:hypothetical protein